ncbi:MAG TPA: hypothetical protein VKV26_16395 [Dehalococcoidia bacterium]|nr:hypothetical protein [Dehalococcoidia bacterium]
MREEASTDEEAAIAVSLPTADEARALHQRLLDGSRTVSADIADAYFDHLVRRLRASYPNVDEHLWSTAAGDTLISYLKRPTAYDPIRLDLEPYLYMSAKRDLLNELAKQRRHQLRAVELSEETPEHRVNEFGDPARFLERQETLAEALAGARPPLPPSLEDGLTPVEARVMEMIRDKVRRTAEYAEVMGITHLPRREQAELVNNMKDKLKHRIRRAGVGDG